MVKQNFGIFWQYASALRALLGLRLSHGRGKGDGEGDGAEGRRAVAR